MEEKILYYLKTHCSGITNAVSASQICQAFGISDRTLRQLKRKIVLTIDARVASSENGYFYCTSKGELKIAKAEYTSRIRECRKMTDRYDIEIGEQEGLF